MQLLSSALHPPVHPLPPCDLVRACGSRCDSRAVSSLRTPRPEMEGGGAKHLRPGVERSGGRPAAAVREVGRPTGYGLKEAGVSRRGLNSRD